MRAVGFAACFLILAGSTAESALAQSGATAPESSVTDSASVAPLSVSTLPPPAEVRRRGGVAITEIIGLNVMVWSYDRFIRAGDTSGFHVGLNSWGENFQHGFEFDDNHFNTNQIGHPYQGSLNYSAARSNGFGYWGSLPFSFLGSFIWEYFMEANPPAINDWINTGLGGAAVGESTFRLAALVLDNSDTGTSRVFREIGAFAINPVRGFNRLIYGRSRAVSRNPGEWRPNALGIRMLSGVIATDSVADAGSDSTQAYLEFDFRYGDPFRGAYRKPYETFRLEAQVNVGNSSGISRFQTAGILFGVPLGDDRPAKSMITGWQRYDYIASPNFEFGGQSFDAAYLARWGSGRSQLTLAAELGWLVLGAVKTDYTDFTGREYDYGMGTRTGLEAEYSWNGRRVGYVRHGTAWEWTFNGNPGMHQVSLTRARVDLPVFSFCGLGGEYLFYHRRSVYDDFPDVTTDSGEYRLFIDWFL